MVGLLEDVSRSVRAGFQRSGDLVFVLGDTLEELGGSEYLAVIHDLERGTPPRLDLAAEAALHRLLAAAASEGLLASAHDAAEGGLAVALAECCLFSGIGLEVALQGGDLRPDALLFGESASRVVATCHEEHGEALVSLAGRHGVPIALVGRTGGVRIRIEPGIDIDLWETHDLWARTLPEVLR